MRLACALVYVWVQVVPKQDGIFFVLSDEKTGKYTHAIREALDGGVLGSGEANKLAGRLTWATSHLFFRMGRAMTRPIFAEKGTKQGIGPWPCFHSFGNLCPLLSGLAKSISCCASLLTGGCLCCN